MLIREKAIALPAPTHGSSLIDHVRVGLGFHLKTNEIPIRYAVTGSDDRLYNCEIGVIADAPASLQEQAADLFEIRRRKLETTDSFNAVLLVPTGIGAEIGGHAGDATAVARLLAESCDRLVLHPNVANASDINELPGNALYVEGSILTRLLMGTIGLQETRANRVLVMLDDHPDTHFVDAAINSVSAARATYGLECPEVVCLNPSIRMFAEYADSGRAVGRVENLEHCLHVLDETAGTYDAVALSSVIRVPREYHLDYFRSEGDMVNP